MPSLPVINIGTKSPPLLPNNSIASAVLSIGFSISLKASAASSNNSSAFFNSPLCFLTAIPACEKERTDVINPLLASFTLLDNILNEVATVDILAPPISAAKLNLDKVSALVPILVAVLAKSSPALAAEKANLVRAAPKAATAKVVPFNNFPNEPNEPRSLSKP